jgi:hypothetical protein
LGAYEFTELFFEDRRVLLPSSYWLTNFKNLHKTLLKGGRQLLVAFQNGLVKIREVYESIGIKRFKFTTE